jgi:hypothetical protein
MIRRVKLFDEEGYLISVAPSHRDPTVMSGIIWTEKGPIISDSLLSDIDFVNGAFSKLNFTTNEKIFVDADEVLFDFYSMFNSELNKRYGTNLDPRFRPSDLDYASVREDLHARKFLNHLGNNWPEQTTPFPDARLCMTALKNFGFQVNVITAIKAEWAPSRIRTLKSAGIPYDAVYYTDNVGKADFLSALCKQNDKFYFVDDMLKNCVAVKEKFPNARCFSVEAPYNELTKARTANKQYLNITIEPSIEKTWESLLSTICKQAIDPYLKKC